MKAVIFAATLFVSISSAIAASAPLAAAAAAPAKAPDYQVSKDCKQSAAGSFAQAPAQMIRPAVYFEMKKSPLTKPGAKSLI